jgi:iron complex outermembrane receptor protein
LGVRYFSPDRRWQAEFNAYLFRLKDAIVLRRDEDGAEFFENAGSTKQDGLEAVFQGVIIQKNRFSLHGLASGAWQPYTFDTYRQGTEDYSGNKLTGVPPLTGTVAADISYGAGWYANLTHTYTGVLPLNDANSTFAPPANLLMARLGFRKTLRNVIMEFFGGGNNLLQANYSSGYDLNAAGGRYFNPSATRYFYAGIRFVPGFR